MSMTRFNPIMVRLQHNKIAILYDEYDAFQSHNGSIATIRNTNCMVQGAAKFQSHNGSIATRTLEERKQEEETMFQSHNGSIATPITVKVC